MYIWTITLVVFSVLQALDVYTTNKALKLGGVEGNPVLEWVISKVGRLWPLLKLALAFGGLYLLWTEGLIYVVWVLCAIYVYVVYSNIKAIRILKE